jgi:hypothetical protein
MVDHFCIGLHKPILIMKKGTCIDSVKFTLSSNINHVFRQIISLISLNFMV